MPASMTLPDLASATANSGVRSSALANWQATGWPGPRVESWRFTKLALLEGQTFAPAHDFADQPAGAGMDAAASIGAHVLRFVNGVVDPSDIENAPEGVTISALATDEDAMSHLRQMVPPAHPVSDLSLAVMSAGIIIDIKGRVDMPLMLSFEGDGAATSAHPVVFVRLFEGSYLQLAEWHASTAGLSAPLTGIDIAAGARLEQVKVQTDGQATTHLAATGVTLGAGASIDGFSLSTGGRLARLETHVCFAGEGADCNLSAIYMGRGEQHQDITTYMDHAVPNCTSNQIIAVYWMIALAGCIRAVCTWHQTPRKPMVSRWRGPCCCPARLKSMPSPNWKSMLMTLFARMGQQLASWMPRSCFI